MQVVIFQVSLTENVEPIAVFSEEITRVVDGNGEEGEWGNSACGSKVVIITESMGDQCVSRCRLEVAHDLVKRRI